VQGALDVGVPSYRAIPYAAPPVGALRWRAPQPATAWTASLDASAFGAACIQLDTSGDLLVGGSEDCLTLNVWYPPGARTAGTKLPVLTFLHGGYFVKGSATYQWHGETVYDGAALALAANAVVVTVQYRLGVFGYLAHPSLSAADAPHGNYGLLDQIAALKFVQTNIAAFGGDPGNVTLFGQSSGGSSVAALMASPLAAGLFAKGIIESGGFSAYSVASGTSDATTVASSVGCTNASDVAACLRGIPADAVATALPDSALGPARWHFLTDGYALPDDPLSLFIAGTFNKVPVILGTNRDELSALVYDYLRAASLPTPTTQATYESDVGALYPADTAQILAYYPYSAYTASPVAGLAQLIADDQYTCPTRQAARALAAGGVPTYRYLFVHSLDPSDASGGGGGNSRYGAYHFLEVPFIFHALAPSDFAFSTDELALSSQMSALWGSFARTGAPSGGSVSWPEYPGATSGVDAGGPVTDPYLALDVQSTRGDGIRSTFCDFWNSR
jgi:para-nitrobenzyl esterase